ncbi:putative nuclease HARBI1 [Pleurodeles waltl]|uniref:putative nuclease HARBI1 n=1 Tax=Pleurodeles waltl TaxID=8319 RepID=UPI003709A2C0
MEEHHIITHYQLDHARIRVLCPQLQSDLLPDIRQPTAIPPTVQVVSILHFLATGSFQGIVGMATGMSEPLFSNVLGKVLSALVRHMDSYIQFSKPVNMPSVKADLYALGHIPHVIGAIDGTHIASITLRADEQVYRNRKGFHSMNVHMVCLADQYNSWLTARFPGSVHDSYMLRNSSVPPLMAPLQQLRTYLIGEYDECICHHCYPSFTTQSVCDIVECKCWFTLSTGDSSYPILSWLLTPVKNPRTRAEEHYNEALGRTRRVVERTFDLLKARSRCLHISAGYLQYSPQKVCQIAVACCMLHNLALRRIIPFLEEVGVEDNPVAEEGGNTSDEDGDEEDVGTRKDLIQQCFS